jgi:glutathione S-transferase
MPFSFSDYPLTTATALAALIQFEYFGIKVSKVRIDEKFDAPAIVGNAKFERALRVQMNTLEQLPLTLTALFAYAELSKNDKVAAYLGVGYIIGRALYAMGYYEVHV